MTRGIRTTQHVFGSGDAADDEIIDYGSNANGHWELYKSGRIKQWGYKAAASYGPHTLTFPVKFKQKINFLTVQCLSENNENAMSDYILPGTLNLASVSIYGSGSSYSAGSIVGFYFEAMGV